MGSERSRDAFPYVFTLVTWIQKIFPSLQAGLIYLPSSTVPGVSDKVSGPFMHTSTSSPWSVGSPQCVVSYLRRPGRHSRIIGRRLCGQNSLLLPLPKHHRFRTRRPICFRVLEKLVRPPRHHAEALADRHCIALDICIHHLRTERGVQHSVFTRSLAAGRTEL